MKNFNAPSNFTKQFSQVRTPGIVRSQFDRSFTHKTTFNAGYLVPFYSDEVLAGDTFNVRSTIFARMATPLFPVMDNMKCDVHFWYVPFRLVWDNFVKMMGERKAPDDSIDYVFPTVTAPAGGYDVGTLYDYFGFPTDKAGYDAMSLYFRAYNMIYNEWYRDQNLIDPVPFDTGDGPDDPADFVLLRRGKRHDYFTSCLPWTQKGDVVTLPLGTTAPVIGNGKALGFTDSANHTGGLIMSNSNYIPQIANSAYGVNLSISTYTQGPTWNAAGTPMGITASAANSGLIADLSAASAATINQLREAFSVQQLLETDARGGTRFWEILNAHFHVQSPDARLQRPEFLGGGSMDVNTNAIANTAGSTGDVGDLAAFSVFSGNGIGYVKSFVEPGMVIGIVSVRADLTYQQGLERRFSRSTRYDLYWPSLANLGEQAVLNKEIYTQGTSADDDVFGYQERYAEYRYKPSMITGQFRSTFAQTLDAWHLSQEFSSLPVLQDAMNTGTFISENPPLDRVLAVNSTSPENPTPHFIFDSFTKQICVRPMQLNPIPAGLFNRL